VTTKAKAKAIQGDIDKLVNLAKDGSIQTQRRLFASLGNDKETAKSFTERIAPSFKERKGGYTRIINLPRRKGDAAEIVRIEWVKPMPEKEEKTKDEKKSKGKRKKKESTKKKVEKITKTSKKK
jgi:large subunit ribosomal protein L17